MTGGRPLSDHTGRPDPEWRKLAACTDQPDLFDVKPTGRSRRTGQYPSHIRPALGVCAGCPVREPCLVDALATDSTGIRGGHVLRPGKAQGASIRPEDRADAERDLP